MSSEKPVEWPITEVAALTGTTSRTLRHYGDVGLLTPSRVGANGLRYYDRDGLVRLQQILLLRGLGLGLGEIRRVLERETDVRAALERHIAELRGQQDRIARQLASVQRTLTAINEGEELEMAEMFDGFDHTKHRGEVEERWGKKAYADSAAWWESKAPAERADWQRQVKERSRAWSELAATDASPHGAAAQELARAHVEWLKNLPGTPAASGDPVILKKYVLGLAEMYVADERFAANYGGAARAAFVKAALERYVSAQL